MPRLLRTLVVLALTGLVLIAVVDGGSVLLTKMTVPDQVRQAGWAAAEVARDQPLNRRTAMAALEAAKTQAGPSGVVVDDTSFTLNRDGSLTLSGHRTAPSLLLDRVPALRDLAVVTSSATVEGLPYR